MHTEFKSIGLAAQRGVGVNLSAAFVAALFGGAPVTADCKPLDGAWDSTIGDPGMPAEVRGLTTWKGDLIAGGTFTMAGGNAINRVARWDAAAGAWQPLGEPPDDGVGGAVRALIEYNGDLIAGGGFTTAGGVSAIRVARFDGRDWHAMGDGFNQVVSALAVFNGDLYAGGTFTNTGAGNNPISRLARWDDVNEIWLPVAGSINNPVTSLAVLDGELYVGGTFSQIDGVTFTNIARYNGSTFSSVGGGTGGQVSGLAVGSDAMLYAGGTFTTAGGVSANRIARWNGASWEPLGAGFSNNTVFTVAELNGVVYAGGTFTSSGGQSVVRVGIFDGENWLSMHGPASSNVLGIHVHDGQVIVGGLFTSIGNVSANRIAVWDPCPVPTDCPGDLTGSGSVGVADLLELLSCWGPVEPGSACEAADLTESGSVGVADLLDLLGAWGPCP